jgi:hypothetical protein
MKIKQEIKGRWNAVSPVFGYFIPGRNEVVKVEKVHHTRYIAHFSEGLERVHSKDMRIEKWECRGKWEAINENV